MRGAKRLCARRLPRDAHHCAEREEVRCLAAGSGRECVPPQEDLGDLDGVQCRALAEVVVDGPHREPVRLGRIAPDPPYEHLVSSRGVARGGAAR